MNSKNKTLRKAVRLMVRGQLTRCIQLLEPKMPLFRDNANYFYLLGRCYFSTGHRENAKLYLERGLQKDPNHQQIHLMQACFAVKEYNTYRAISIWLKLENSGCHLPCLRYGLDQIRRIHDAEELYNFTRSPKFAKLLPALPGLLRYHIMRRLGRLLLVLLFLTGVYLGYRFGMPQVQQWYKEWRKQREAAASISLAELESSEYLTFEKKQTLFTFDEAQLEKLTSTIRKNYDTYKDNLVQRDINKIFYSNASAKVKNKFRIIEALLGKQQEIYNLKHNFSFLEVRQNPQLYQNCFVRWQGKPTNVRITDDGKLEFTLLVGYTDGSRLEGQVPVRMNDLVGVPIDQTLTVFGRVHIVDLAARPQQQPIAEAAGKKSQTNQPAANQPALFYIEAKTLAHF